MSINRYIAALCIAGAAPFALSTSVLAQQSPPEEITVTGSYGNVPDNVRSLSQGVSYADLDLSTKEGREILRQRVSLTARFLCDKLGEADVSSPLIPSCRDAAVKDAMSRVQTTEESAAPRGTTWVRPAPWQAPYPEDWYTKYPYVAPAP